LILFSGSQEEIQNVKSLQRDAKWSLKLTWIFGLGELKRIYGANVDDTTTPKKYTGHQTAFNNGHTPIKAK
jgi:hypothetical protein